MSYGDHIGHLRNLNEMVVCPYNNGHVVGITRMQRHLHKCRQRNPEKAAAVSICPYNQSHHIPTADISAHLVICQDHLAHKFQTLMRVGTTKVSQEKEVLDPFTMEVNADELRCRLRELEAGYYGDADTTGDEGSVTSGLTLRSPTEWIDDIPEEPIPVNPIPRSLKITKNIHGQCWTGYKGAGYDCPYERHTKSLPDNQVQLRTVDLPPCEQEEIDNWT